MGGSYCYEEDHSGFGVTKKKAIDVTGGFYI